ncbi:MAG: trehalase [Ignavibacteriales bacterium]|nr:trehalase [Ignavibacteriales bacterium]
MARFICNSVLLSFFLSLQAAGQLPDKGVLVPVNTVFDSLLHEEDTDGDSNITIDDPHMPGTVRGDKRFWLKDTWGKSYEIAGHYFLSNLLQELTLARLDGHDTARIFPSRIFEPPSQRISRFIREYFWDSLTRRVDEKNLDVILADEKTISKDGYRYLYVAPSDRSAFDYFTAAARRNPSLRLKVVRLPRTITADYVKSLEGSHGIVTLALQQSGEKIEGVPFVVPGGRFNEMYGWDSYFIALGLLQDGRVDLAKAMVDNFVYQITHYGKILNANRTYFLTRSQPPFLSSMVIAVHEHLQKSGGSGEWLKTGLKAAIKEYRDVWTSPQRTTAIGLNRYFDLGSGPPPEVEPGHFDPLFRVSAKKFGMGPEEFERSYRSGKLKVPELDEYFIHDRCMRESGHDTSYRLEGCCADLATVDLNSLLYKTESDVADLIEKHFGGRVEWGDGTSETSARWRSHAKQRKELVDRYLWNETRGMFFDFDVKEGRQREYVSATILYPLWAGLASEEQARLLVRNALPLLEESGGIVSSTEASRGPLSDDRPPRQWDYPNGWAPHQMLAWDGLRRYGYDEAAVRLIYRWLFTITINAAHYNGTVTEKYDVVKRSHQVFAEYGNVGTTFAYITREGFGWTNASYQVGLSMLPGRYRKHLDDLIPPEWVF